MDAREFCTHCNIAFALAEERVNNKHGVFHPECEKNRERRYRLRELIIRHAIETGTPLRVIPHGFQRR